MSALSQRVEKPRVEVGPHSGILMTCFLAQGVPVRGPWQGVGVGGERADTIVGPCVLPDTRPLGKHLSLRVTKGPFRRQ